VKKLERLLPIVGILVLWALAFPYSVKKRAARKSKCRSIATRLEMYELDHPPKANWKVIGAGAMTRAWRVEQKTEFF